MNTAVRSFPEPTGPVSTVPQKSRGREIKNRTTARPIKRILERDTGKLVGWLYEWNTGTVVPMWKGKTCENVVYV